MSVVLGPVRVWIEDVELTEHVHEVRMETAAPVITAPPSVETTPTIDDGRGQFDGWFCIRTDPWPCPNPGCGFVADFQTAAHLIVVWERKDAQTLLVTAERCKRIGRNPRVVTYDEDFGPAISWEEWVNRGRPVHGLSDRPDGWDGGMHL